MSDETDEKLNPIKPISTTLSSDEVKRAIDWLVAKAKTAVQCVICKSESWKVLPDLVGFVAYGPARAGYDTLDLRGDVYPQIQMVCTVCGQTVFINAVLAGVFDENRGGEVSNG